MVILKSSVLRRARGAGRVTIVSTMRSLVWSSEKYNFSGRVTVVPHNWYACHLFKRFFFSPGNSSAISITAFSLRAMVHSHYQNAALQEKRSAPCLVREMQGWEEAGHPARGVGLHGRHY